MSIEETLKSLAEAALKVQDQLMTSCTIIKCNFFVSLIFEYTTKHVVSHLFTFVCSFVELHESGSYPPLPSNEEHSSSYHP